MNVGLKICRIIIFICLIYSCINKSINETYYISEFTSLEIKEDKYIRIFQSIDSLNFELCEPYFTYDERSNRYCCDGFCISTHMKDTYLVMVIYKTSGEIDEIFRCTRGEYRKPSSDMNEKPIEIPTLDSGYKENIYFIWNQPESKVISRNGYYIVTLQDTLDYVKYANNAYTFKTNMGHKLTMLKDFEMDSTSVNRNTLLIRGFNHKDYMRIRELLDTDEDIMIGQFYRP